MKNEKIRILVVNGPNLNLLGKREPGIYGSESLQDIQNMIDEYASKKGVLTDHFQSCVEGLLVESICDARGKYDAVIINPAAFTHSSPALRDAISASGLPVIEVHISNTHKREGFRHSSLTVPVCIGQIMGFGSYGYILAIDALVNFIEQEP